MLARTHRNEHRTDNSWLAGIDLSSWVSWACFMLGFELALGPELIADFKSGGTGLRLVVLSVLVFFVLVLLIQRHMRLSLLANTFGRPQQVVTTGIFRYSRNPIYLSFLIPLASLGYFSVGAALAAIVLYIVLMTRVVIANEERGLEAVFGQDYVSYRATTPRWLWFV